MDDPVLRSAKREAVLVLAFCFLTMAWVLGVCWMLGYNRKPGEITFWYGVPDWVLWGIAVPWLTCTVISSGYAVFAMRDNELGDELPESTDELV